MIRQIFNRIFDYFSYPGIDPDEREKRRIAVFAFMLTAIVFIPIAFYNFVNEAYTTAVLNVTTAVVMLIIFVMLRFVKDGRKIYRVGTLFLAFLFLFDILKGGMQGALTFWSFIYPLGTFFMLGVLEGAVWNGAFLLLAVLLMYSSHFTSEIYYYSDFYISRFSFVYLIISLLTTGYESARRATLASLIKKQRRLNSNYNKMKVELELSKKIQKNIIPGTPPEFEGLQIASLYKPLGEIGGDFYEYILMTSPPRIGFFIADVTGHGVPSALITSMLKILIATSGKHREHTSGMLFYINKHLYEKSGGYLTTAFYCIYDHAKMSLDYSRAGHSLPYIIRNGSAEKITSDGYILGAKKNPEFESKKIQLQKGDKLLLFTDGLIETANREYITFETVISETLLKHSHRNINDFVKNIYNDCSAFRDGSFFEDDISIIGIEVTGNSSGRSRK
ncbi:MAG TPA: SpoIIE family protein phosphatase [Spirochaetota bacterium]|nr:SpoIIE family protein phosphatase [Spirochaetota bacterium]